MNDSIDHNIQCMNNIFSALPPNLEAEVFETLVNSETVKIERIISKGHTTPESDWYDQTQNEWVIILQGEATLTFEHGEKICLTTGDYLNIPAHQKHRVSWTDPNQETIWLAVFY